MHEDQTPLDLQDSGQLALNPIMLGYLKESAKWARFLGIVGFIMSGLVAVAAIVVMLVSSPMPMGPKPP